MRPNKRRRDCRKARPDRVESVTTANFAVHGQTSVMLSRGGIVYRTVDSTTELAAKSPRFNDPIGAVFKARTVDRPKLGCRGYAWDITPISCVKVACECVECRAKRRR